MHVLHQSPQEYKQEGVRWKLRTLLAACDWLSLKTLPGMCQLLHRLKVSWKRARAHVHSPDREYVDKLRCVRLNFLGIDLELAVFLFQDEFTYYRQPSLAFAYAAAGKEQPRAELGWKGDYSWRIAAALNAYTGQVSYMQAAHFSIPKLVEFYRHVRQDFPQATLLYMAQDNWPIHFHPDVLAALQPQRYQWDRHIPAHWPQEPSAKAKFLDLPIQVLSLPTYASWTNPIEKLWRLLKQEVLHLHRFEDDWVGLKQAVHEFLDQFDQESHYLLRYVGLSNPSKIYHSVVCQ